MKMLLIFTLAMALCPPAVADSSSPALAAYYDRQMAIVNGVTYAWRGADVARRLSIKAVRLGGQP